MNRHTDKAFTIIGPAAVYVMANALFVMKYTSRTAYSPVLLTAVYVALAISAAWLMRRWRPAESVSRLLVAAMATAAIIVIAALLKHIDPMSVNVDRWSATTFFLDGLTSGTYPYGIHTHVCDTNFPSPFPLWHYINLPFWLMGDVGYGLIFFLLLFIFATFWFFRSWRAALTLLTLLLLSPAYWWEVMVRSDGLSNAILVYCLILLMEKKDIRFSNHWIATSAICALAALTRLSAIIPLAIYIVKDFFASGLRRQAMSLACMALLVFLFFAPFIFWDTETWVFFSRNPFMSQSSTGSPWVLLVMAAIAICLSWTYNTSFDRYMASTAVFVFCFFLVSILVNHFIIYNPHKGVFNNSNFDISYMTLAMPYALYTLSNQNRTS